MNPPTSQDSTEATHLEKLRHQLSTDMEAIQEKEASLRAYEQRLRLLIEHTHQIRPAPPTTEQYRFSNAPDQAGVDAAWEKYHRASATLEAARRSLSDDRQQLKDREEQVMIREQEVMRREAWVKVREQELTAKLMPAPGKKKTPSAFAAARSMLSLGKSG